MPSPFGPISPAANPYLAALIGVDSGSLASRREMERLRTTPSLSRGPRFQVAPFPDLIDPHAERQRQLQRMSGFEKGMVIADLVLGMAAAARRGGGIRTKPGSPIRVGRPAVPGQPGPPVAPEPGMPFGALQPKVAFQPTPPSPSIIVDPALGGSGRTTPTGRLRPTPGQLPPGNITYVPYSPPPEPARTTPITPRVPDDFFYSHGIRPIPTPEDPFLIRPGDPAREVSLIPRRPIPPAPVPPGFIGPLTREQQRQARERKLAFRQRAELEAFQRTQLSGGRSDLPPEMQQEVLNQLRSRSTIDPRTGRRVYTTTLDPMGRELVTPPQDRPIPDLQRELYPRGANPDQFRSGEGALFGQAFDTFYSRMLRRDVPTPEAKAVQPPPPATDWRTTKSGKLFPAHLTPVGSQTVRTLDVGGPLGAGNFAAITAEGRLPLQSTAPGAPTRATIYEPLTRGDQKIPGERQPDGSYLLDMRFPIAQRGIASKGGMGRVLNLDAPLPNIDPHLKRFIYDRYGLDPKVPARTVLTAIEKELLTIPQKQEPRTALELLLDITGTSLARQRDLQGRDAIRIPPNRR